MKNQTFYTNWALMQDPQWGPLSKTPNCQFSASTSPSLMMSMPHFSFGHRHSVGWVTDVKHLAGWRSCTCSPTTQALCVQLCQTSRHGQALLSSLPSFHQHNTKLRRDSGTHSAQAKGPSNSALELCCIFFCSLTDHRFALAKKA